MVRKTGKGKCLSSQYDFIAGFNYNIPIAWIWDMLDEFIYQFQTFCQNRAKMTSDDPKIEFWSELNEYNEEFWTLKQIEEELSKFVKVSKI